MTSDPSTSPRRRKLTSTSDNGDDDTKVCIPGLSLKSAPKPKLAEICVNCFGKSLVVSIKMHLDDHQDLFSGQWT